MWVNELKEKKTRVGFTDDQKYCFFTWGEGLNVNFGSEVFLVFYVCPCGKLSFLIVFTG